MEKKMMVRPVVGCGGRHDVSTVLIFLHLFEKSRVEFFVRSRWLMGCTKMHFIMLPSATGVAVIPR